MEKWIFKDIYGYSRCNKGVSGEFHCSNCINYVRKSRTSGDCKHKDLDKSMPVFRYNFCDAHPSLQIVQPALMAIIRKRKIQYQVDRLQ